MEQNKFLKIFSILAFFAFASVSCWATAESLHLLLPSWPLAMCWIVTIGFFFIASWGTKMIVDSLNQNIYVEKRGVRLVCGVCIVLFFWLVCSMPTNTHTFFFRNIINDKVTADIATTQDYLTQIKDNVVTEEKIKLKCAEFENSVEIKLGELESEIKNDANPGFGPKAKEILSDFAKLLGVAEIKPLSYKGVSVQERQKLYTAYRNKIYILLKSRLLNIVNTLTPPNKDYMKLAANNYRNLELVRKYIEDGTLNLNQAEDIQQICDKLNEGYSTIRTYQQFVNFKNDTDKQVYTADNPVTKVKRTTSVFDVWKDFFKGEYAGHGFLFWIIMSILVDIAAFIFFDIAFKREE